MLKKRIKKDRMNVENWTSLRRVQEHKKHYGGLFRNRLKTLIQPARVQQINFSFAKIQQRLGAAVKLEKNLKDILKHQESTKQKLRETLEYYSFYKCS